MLYDHYREKMKKVAAFLGRLYAHKVLCLMGLVVLVAIIAGLMAVKGTILFETECAAEVEYGDKTGYRVYPVLSIAKYEYCEAGTGSWSLRAPIYPGDYEVRAVARTALGQPVYTESHSFSIVPRRTTVRVAESTINYGEEPTAKADLARGDRLECTIRLGSRFVRDTEAWVDRASIRILAKNGEDRTACYQIEDTPQTSLSIKPRKLRITVADASKEFDDVKLTYDAYEVSGGKLLKGDSLVATFRVSIIEAGTVENTPSLIIFNQEGRDVTSFYDLDIRSGKLTVEKRPLILHSGSQSFVYNGRAQECTQYTVDESTPLLKGHSIRHVSGTGIVDVGTLPNALTVSIRNARGEDRTTSYSLFVDTGTLTVTPRTVTVHTPTTGLVYNGQAQSATQDIFVENGVNDLCRTVKPATQTEVGSVENRMSVAFYRGTEDVTKNYKINYVYGTLTVIRRKVYVKLRDVSREYDKQPLTSTAFTCDTGRGYDILTTDTLTLKAVGEVSRVGTVINRYVDGSVEIRDKSGRSVLSNYDITVEDGTLTVLPRAITVTSASQSWVYDGTPKHDYGFEVTRGSLVKGQELKARVVTECLHVGIYQNLMTTSETRVWDGGEDVTDQYAITHAYGRLQILGHPITVYTESGEWMYDGQEHSIPNSQAVHLDPATPLLEGDSITFAGGRSITSAGTVPNTYIAVILDGSGSNVTRNYDITYKTGTLTVYKRPIGVFTGTGTRIYNGRSEMVGTPLLMKMNHSPNRLVTGHEMSIGTWNTDSCKDVGSYPNEYEVAITDRDGSDVTGNYEVTYEYGTMEVLPRVVDLTVDVTKVYSGLSFESVEAGTVNGTSLANGHTAVALFGASAIDVGTYNAAVNIIIRDERDRNVTHNYVHTCERGTVTITPRHITLTTATAAKVYDGEPLEAHEVTTAARSLPLGYGHRAEMKVTGRGTEVGIYPNTAELASLIILDSRERDVTANYVVDDLEEGVLTVRYDATVTVTTGSATKSYDGLPLREKRYSMDVTQGKLPDGFTVTVQTTGSITMPGSADNTATVTVRNAHGEDVTALVEVVLRLGTLTVTKSEDPDRDAVGSFDPGEVGTYDLRMASYGVFTGRDWLEAKPYPYADRVVTLPGLVLKSLGVPTRIMRFTNMRQMLMPYYVTPSSQTVPDTDTVYGDPSTERYSVEAALYNGDFVSLYMSLPEFARSALLGTHYADEKAYRTFVQGQYLKVDDETRLYMEAFAARYGLDASDPEIIANVAEVIRKAAVYTEGYDPMLDREGNIAIAFLDKYREGSDRHFATAATLLYRTLGVPARYVTGYRVTMQETWNVPKIKEPGHAWVEVYINGFGWFAVDPTGEAKKPVDDKRPVLELEPAFAYKRYDGMALTAPNRLTATATLDVLLAQGYTYKVSVLGEQTEIGVSESVITGFTLYDPKGLDVTAKYRLVKNTGLLRVVGESMTVMLSQISKTYDGRPLTYQADDYRILSVPEGLTVELTLELSMTDVGVLTLNDINRQLSRFVTQYRVMKDDSDVTEAYPLLLVLSGDESAGGVTDQPKTKQATAAEPVLIIKPRAIELTAASEIRMDDGTPLTAPEVTLTGGRLVEGHRLLASAIGICTAPGTVENAVGDVLIVDEAGNDVTSFYTVARVSGTLTLVGNEDD